MLEAQLKLFLFYPAFLQPLGSCQQGRMHLCIWNAALAAAVVPEPGWSPAFPFLVVDTAWVVKGMKCISRRICSIASCVWVVFLEAIMCKINFSNNAVFYFLHYFACTKRLVSQKHI